MRMRNLLTTAVVFCALLLCVSAVAAPGATLDNLQAAYNGESNASAKYAAFAKKADEEGYGQVASLFRAASPDDGDAAMRLGHHLA